MTTINLPLFSIITVDEIKTTFYLKIFTNVPNEIILFIMYPLNEREI